METSGVPSCGHLPLGAMVVGKGWVQSGFKEHLDLKRP